MVEILADSVTGIKGKTVKKGATVSKTMFAPKALEDLEKSKAVKILSATEVKSLKKEDTPKESK